MAFLNKRASFEAMCSLKASFLHDIPAVFQKQHALEGSWPRAVHVIFGVSLKT